jgi:hypothetical protein
MFLVTFHAYYLLASSFFILFFLLMTDPSRVGFPNFTHKMIGGMKETRVVIQYNA